LNGYDGSREGGTTMEQAPIKAPKPDSTVIGAIAYIIGFYSILIFLLAKDDKFARFHALQALLLDLVFFLASSIVGSVVAIAFFAAMVFGFVATFATVVGIVTFPLIFIALFVISFVVFVPLSLLPLLFRLYLAYEAFNGRSPMVPKIGKMALEHI